MHDLKIIIPARDENECIRDVIRESGEYRSRLVVLCDSESDTTVPVARELGVGVMINGFGPGKGNAIRYAFQTTDAEIIVLMDADGAHDFNEIEKLVQPIREGKAGMVIGSRMAGGSEELSNGLGERIRMLGNTMSARIIRWLYRTQLTDVNNGFRAIRSDIAMALPLREPRFSIEIEMVLECLRMGADVVDVPCFERARKHGESRLNCWVQLNDCLRLAYRHLPEALALRFFPAATS